MSEKFVTMQHKRTGAVIRGVHPDAVPAHEAIGYEVIPEPEKPVKVEAKAADNDASKKGKGKSKAADNDAGEEPAEEPAE
jgi:hypothetical protein